MRIDATALAAVFERQPVVIAAWLFGSAQEGELRPGSDVDLGVLFAASPTLDTLADLRAEVQAALRIDDIDLIPLNEAGPILRFEAISGRPIFCRDVSRRAEFASLTAREYEDAMALLAYGLAQG